jgi:hypothetical protein
MDFREFPTCEVRRIPLLQRWVNRAGRGKRRTRPAQLVIVLLLPSSGALELAEALLQSRDPLASRLEREPLAEVSSPVSKLNNGVRVLELR